MHLTHFAAPLSLRTDCNLLADEAPHVRVLKGRPITCPACLMPAGTPADRRIAVRSLAEAREVYPRGAVRLVIDRAIAALVVGREARSVADEMRSGLLALGAFLGREHASDSLMMIVEIADVPPVRSTTGLLADADDTMGAAS